MIVIHCCKLLYYFYYCCIITTVHTFTKFFNVIPFIFKIYYMELMEINCCFCFNSSQTTALVWQMFLIYTFSRNLAIANSVENCLLICKLNWIFFTRYTVACIKAIKIDFDSKIIFCARFLLPPPHAPSYVPTCPCAPHYFTLLVSS